MTDEQGAKQLTELLRPFPADAMAAYPVSDFVNNPRNDTPEAIEAMDA
jgi:putative SOS response-associated peptidase YedK